MSADFLSRWSRRKAEAKQTVPEPVEDAASPGDIEPGGEVADASAPPAEAGELAERPAAMTAEEIAALPPVDELTSSSDLAPFLRAGVPNLLRNAALRRMWTVDPGIRDFLNDAREYAYDWNTPGGVPGTGPLRASDDVKAMVRRIFDGAPAPAEEENGATGAEPQSPSAPPEPVQEAPEALSADATSLRPPSASSEEAPPVALDTTMAAAPPREGPRRSRRHGGATPA